MFLTTMQVIMRLILGGVFLWAGVVKIPDLELFSYTVRAYNLLPEFLILPVTILMPYLECVIGLCLILGFWTHANTLIASGLLIAFTSALGTKIYQGVNMSCGCFGFGTERASMEWVLLQDVLLLSFALVLFWKQKIPFSLDEYWQSLSDRGRDAAPTASFHD
ncbi:MAG: DoxX family membrane protein [Candidatus Latescibacteria bacterium]|nr:DoxX family membrane protein [Candidatus Latescibacterota bacterium]